MSLIKLGIAMDYPVEWEFGRILRDLIQNFYDSIGWENFAKEFMYMYEPEWGRAKKYTVKMSTKGHPFSYEWLVYVGGSTKTSSAGKYIGKYGEGFKISMLSLWKMGITDVYMHSSDWKISPCIYEEKVENSVVRMLGYEYEKTEDDGETTLVMHGVPWYAYDELSEALLHFFYKENPLFGEKLGESENCIIYRRSKEPIPCAAYRPRFKGILYYNYLARGRISIPYCVVIRGGNTDVDSRKRETLADFEAWKLLNNVVVELDAATSYQLLMEMEQNWSDSKCSKYKWETWYYFVCQLVRNVKKSEEYTRKFREKYEGKLAYLDRNAFDKKKNRLINETKIWARENSKKRIVNPIFRYLGAESLVERYQTQQMEKYKMPDALQEKRFRFLCTVFHEVIPYKKIETDKVELKINCENTIQTDPLQFSEKVYSDNIWDAKYKITKVILNPEDLKEGVFQETFVKIADIFLHTYGSSRSERLNALLTYMGGYIIENRHLLENAEEIWDKMTVETEIPWSVSSVPTS